MTKAKLVFDSEVTEETVIETRTFTEKLRNQGIELEVEFGGGTKNPK